MSTFNEIYDLESQDLLHSSCENAASVILAHIQKFSSPFSEVSDEIPTILQLTSDFESVLTHFAQAYSLPFVPDNGWVAIISTLYGVLRPIDREQLYVYFISVYHRFIASGTHGNLLVCSTFRLLLQYHDPELCNFLDSHKLGPEQYAKAWFESLFAGHLSDETLPAMWDVIFLLEEPQFCMLVALVLLLNAKDSLMQKEKEIGHEVVEDTFSLNGDENRKRDKGKSSVPRKSRGMFF